MEKIAGKGQSDKGVRLPKLKRVKVVRDSFTIPEQEYAVLGQLKKACIKAGFEIRKSELIRIGLFLASQSTVAEIREHRTALTLLRAGRPKKSK